MDVEPVEDVDGPEVLGDVVPPELLHAGGQARGVDQLLVVGVVESLLGAEGDLPLHLLDVDEPVLVVVQLRQVVGPLVGEGQHDQHARDAVAEGEEAGVTGGGGRRGGGGGAHSILKRRRWETVQQSLSSLGSTGQQLDAGKHRERAS